MKTAAAALILYLGLGCAAGLPVEELEKLEKLMSRARRLSTNDDGDDASFAACSNELNALYACPTAAGTTLGDDDYWTADDDDDDGDDDDFNPTSCADVQTLLTGICGEGPAVCQAEYHTYMECMYEQMVMSFSGAACDLTCASSTRTPAPTPADFRDADGDGVADVPEGDCCIHGYGMSFSSSPGCGTLAEAAKTCCPWPRLARYSLQQTGEDKTAFDCVSFVSKENCAAQNALWSDDSQLGPGGCAHSASAVKTIDSASASGPALLVTVLAAAATAL